jgi:hypothetical protein
VDGVELLSGRRTARQVAGGAVVCRGAPTDVSTSRYGNRLSVPGKLPDQWLELM